MNSIQISELRRLVKYDAETGLLIWAVDVSNSCKARSPALIAGENEA